MRPHEERAVAARFDLHGRRGIPAMKWLPVLLLAAGCATSHDDPAMEGSERLRALVRALDRPPDPAVPEAERPERKLEELGDEAVPPLANAVRYDASERVRERAAFVLGRIFSKTRAALAAGAYLDALQDSKTADRT